MTEPPAIAETAVRKPLTRTALSWAARGGIAGLVIWIALWSLQGISALFHDASSPPPVAEPPTFNPTSALSLAQFDSGAWQFLDGPGTLSTQTLSTSEAEAKLLEIPSTDPSGDLSDTAQSSDLLKLLKEYGTRTRRSDIDQYTLNQFGIRIVAFVHPKPDERLVAVRWLIPQGEEKAWLITQTLDADSSPSPPNPPTTSEPSIIPPQIPQRLLAHRTDARGETICRLIIADTTFPDLLDQLQRNSWKFDAPPDNWRSGFVTIYLQRQSEAYWMVVTPVADSTSLRVLLLRENSLPSPSATTTSTEASP